MAKESGIKIEGQVIDVQRNAVFTVKLVTGHTVIGHVSGKMRQHEIRILLGDKVEIPTIEGGKIRITIEKFSDVGTNLRIQNKGLKTFKNDNRGDLIITLGVNIPKEINEDNIKLLQTKLKPNIKKQILLHIKLLANIIIKNIWFINLK